MYVRPSLSRSLKQMIQCLFDVETDITVTQERSNSKDIDGKSFQVFLLFEFALILIKQVYS